MNPEGLVQLQKHIGHNFKNADLLKDALTHSSTGSDKNYERLEFLGDRVLGLVISQLLYERFPEESEGDLAKRLAVLVQGKMLAQMARKINLGACVEFSPAERAAGGPENENILADAFEAVLGALYLDSSLEKCHAMIEALWETRFFEMGSPPQHPKTELQEWLQSKGLPLPVYEITGQSGADHLPVFDLELRVEGYAPVAVQGPSRQQAETQAAEVFLKKHKKSDE